MLKSVRSFPVGVRHDERSGDRRYAFLALSSLTTELHRRSVVAEPLVVSRLIGVASVRYRMRRMSYASLRKDDRRYSEYMVANRYRSGGGFKQRCAVNEQLDGVVPTRIENCVWFPFI